MSTHSIQSWVPLFCWIAGVLCFIAGTWGGRPSVLAVVPSLVVIYVIGAARLRRTRTSKEASTK